MPHQSGHFGIQIAVDTWEAMAPEQRERVIQGMYEEAQFSVAPQPYDQRVINISLDVRVERPRGNWLRAEEISTAPSAPSRLRAYSDYALQNGTLFPGNPTPYGGVFGTGRPGADATDPVAGRTATDVAIDWQNRQFLLGVERDFLERRGITVQYDDPNIPSGATYTATTSSPPGPGLAPPNAGNDRPVQPWVALANCLCDRCTQARTAGR